MDQTLSVLFGTAVTLGFVHTIIGIDHSLPFIVIGRARKWSLRKVLGLTTLCGIGHVMTSVLLGGIGISVGLAVVTAVFHGLRMTRLSGLERHVHTLAGLTIAISGLAITLLGI